MDTLRPLLLYSIAVIAIGFGAIHGAQWLVAPGPTLQAAEARVSILPPRIAESIERRAQRDPKPAAEAVSAPAPQMTIKPAALAPFATIREVADRPVRKGKSKKPRASERPRNRQAEATYEPVASGRSDNPY